MCSYVGKTVAISLYILGFLFATLSLSINIGFDQFLVPTAEWWKESQWTFRLNNEFKKETTHCPRYKYQYIEWFSETKLFVSSACFHKCPQIFRGVVDVLHFLACNAEEARSVVFWAYVVTILILGLYLLDWMIGICRCCKQCCCPSDGEKDERV